MLLIFYNIFYIKSSSLIQNNNFLSTNSNLNFTHHIDLNKKIDEIPQLDFNSYKNKIKHNKNFTKLTKGLRRKREDEEENDLNYPFHKRESTADRLKNIETLQLASTIGPFKKKDVGFADTFYYLLSTMVPGVSKLDIDEIYEPNDIQETQIKLLLKIIELKANQLVYNGWYQYLSECTDNIADEISQNLNADRNTLSELLDKKDGYVENRDFAFLKKNNNEKLINSKITEFKNRFPIS